MITLTVLVAVLVCAASSVFIGLSAASTGQSAYQQAKDGMAHLKNGERLLAGLAAGGFSVTTVKQAQSEFTLGQQDFVKVQATLKGLPGIAESAPFVGSNLRALTSLSSLATNFSQIGITACDSLTIVLGALSNPLGDPSKGGLKAADLATVQSNLTAISTLIVESTGQLNALQPGDLTFDPSIAPQLAKVKAQLPALQQSLQEAQAFMGVAATILGVGTPTDYLVELLDSTELRPGGGFVGNIGIMTMNNGLLAGLHVKDVDLLDRPFEFNGGYIPFPAQYQWFPLASNWSVRDSNLDGDFPTDARNAEANYRLEGGSEHVQGVIAITPWLIQKMMGLTGSIYVPEFQETVTPSNLVSLIHFHQLGPGHGSDYVPDPGSLSSQRKRFTAYLFEHFMARVKAVMGAKRSQFIKLAWSALATKDVQIYFNNSAAEQILQRHNLASSITPQPTGDSLMVVDANVIANKANNFITYTMGDKVMIDSNGTATHHLTLTYKWPVSTASSNNNYGSTTFYRDYVRVYVPAHASLLSQGGWAYAGQSKAFGDLVFAGYLSLWYGGSQTISLSWKVPSAAVKAGDSWTYQEWIQRQAGNTWSATMQITLPACGRITAVTAPWQAAKDATNASFKAPLTEDKSYMTTYACAAS